jgi:hypothetical protein
MSRISRLAFAFVFCQPEAAEPIERRLVPLRARIPLHEVEPLDGHIQLRLFRIKEQHELAAPTGAEIERLQAAEAREAVIDMHHVIANFEITKVRQEGGSLRLALLPGGCALSRSQSAMLYGRSVVRLVEQIIFDVDDQP